MQNFEYLDKLPDGIYQIYTPDVLQRIVSKMRFGIIREISEICNVCKDTVHSALLGKHRDDLIVQVLLQKFEKHCEDYYGEKYSPTSLAILYE